VWLLLHSLPDPPPPSPTSSYALPGEVTIDESLPDALPLPEGIWDEVEPGWVLVNYMPTILGQSDNPPYPVIEHTKHVVYLVSPEGIRYQVAEFDPYHFFSIDAWTAGETVAYISSCAEPTYCLWQPTALLDLETGEITSVGYPMMGSTPQFISALPDGTRIWAQQGVGGGYLETGGQGNRSWTQIDRRWSAQYPVVPSPDGNYLALGTSDEWLRSPSLAGDDNGSEVLVMSLTNGEETLTPSLDGDWYCRPLDWLEPTSLAIRCESYSEGRFAYYIYDLVTGELSEGDVGHYDGDSSPRHYVPYDPYVQRDVQLGYGQYAGRYFDGRPEQELGSRDPYPLGIDDHGVLTPVNLLSQAGETLPYFEIKDHVGPLIYISAESSYNRTDETIVVYDMDTGSQRILIGPPLAGPTFGWDPDVDDGLFAFAILNWAVAH